MALLKARGGSGAFRVNIGEEAPLKGVPDLALRKERAANVNGALEAGFTQDFDAALAKARDASLVLVLDEFRDGAAGDVTRPMIYIGTTLPDAARKAQVVLPCANMSEEDGTFRNVQGRVQAYYQARTAPGMARPAAWILEQVAEHAGARAGAR
jgi:NADH-quinone oxidoreductase subunit G